MKKTADMKKYHREWARANRTPTYWAWNHMKQRCYNPATQFYYRYGGRGITVCDEWRNSYQQFLKDMGERPAGLSLDRIDNNKGYSASNCRWATPAQQSDNRGIGSNNTSGHVGVYVRSSKVATHYIAVYRRKYIGFFKTFEEAVIAYKTAKETYNS